MKKIILAFLSCLLLSSCSGNMFRSFMDDTFFTTTYKSDAKAAICTFENNKCINNKIYIDNQLYIEMQTKGKYTTYYTSGRLLAGNFTYADFMEHYTVVSNFSTWADKSIEYRINNPIIATGPNSRLTENSTYKLYISEDSTPYLMVSLGNKAILINNQNAKIMLKELKYIKSIMDEKNNK